MQPNEYTIMAQNEDSHWWYQGLRDLLFRSMDKFVPKKDGLKVLDAGCGTGANLHHLANHLKPGYLGGFDVSSKAVELARQRCQTADIYLSDICNPDLHETGFDLVISTDVIYVPGPDRALPGLNKIAAAMAPGGIFMVNLPAYNWLFSKHDVAIATSHRFVKQEVSSLFEAIGLECILLTYRMTMLFPIVVAKRLPSMICKPINTSDVRSDIDTPIPIINKSLFRILTWENKMIEQGIALPYGSSVFAIAKKI